MIPPSAQQRPRRRPSHRKGARVAAIGVAVPERVLDTAVRHGCGIWRKIVAPADQLRQRLKDFMVSAQSRNRLPADSSLDHRPSAGSVHSSGLAFRDGQHYDMISVPRKGISQAGQDGGCHIQMTMANMVREYPGPVFGWDIRSPQSGSGDSERLRKS